MQNRSNRLVRVQTIDNVTGLLYQSRKRFGELLREICEISGFTQGKLSREAKAERQRLIESGHIRQENAVGSMEQPTISKVMAGVQEPTYFQVFIWLRVIRSHYESTRLAEICKKLDIPVPQFSYELERKLWRLSAFMPPEDLLEVYEESKDETPMEISPSLIEHKEERWGLRDTEPVSVPVLQKVERFKEKGLSGKVRGNSAKSLQGTKQGKVGVDSGVRTNPANLDH